MLDGVPRELAELLERLGLADAGKVRAVEARVRRLGRDLPQFQSVWVDALAQARLLTPYQATEINAGRGEVLRVGPFVIQSKASSFGYAERFAAIDAERRKHSPLVVVEAANEHLAGELAASMDELASRADKLAAGAAPFVSCGREGNRIWGLLPAPANHTAAELLVRHGRMPPAAVLEIARQMAAALEHLESAGLAHGDVSLPNLMLSDKSGSLLLAPGLRPIVRPAEGFGHTDMAPAYYDSVAPEQIDGGAAPDALTDIYGCGCVWWHLLTGRPCFPAGDSLGKLQAHLTMVPGDVRDLAPDVPEHFAEVIKACVAKDRRQRPESASEITRRLGPSTPSAWDELARWMKPAGGATPIHAPLSRPHGGARPAWPVVAASVTLVGFAAMLWAMGLPSRSQTRDRVETTPQPSNSSTESLEPEKASEELVQTPPSPATPRPSAGPNEMILSAEEPIALDPHKLTDGMRVTSPPGCRVTVLVQGSAIVVANEDVLFDGIDFVWQAGSAAGADSEVPAMVRVEAGGVRFRRCTFQAASGQPPDCAAIQWVFPVQRGGLALPTGKLSLSDCVFHRVDAAVDARTAAALTIDCDNLLHLASGPLVRLDHTPPVDEPLGLALKNVTLRKAGAVLEVHDGGETGKPATISINAQLCIFEPRAGGALLSFVGSVNPTALAKAVYWTGEGALVTPEARIAQWTDPSGAAAELNDAAFSIAGLVRSRIEFAGIAEPVAQSNAARRWQAPLPTAEAPGVQTASLPEPLP